MSALTSLKGICLRLFERFKVFIVSSGIGIISSLIIFILILPTYVARAKIAVRSNIIGGGGSKRDKENAVEKLVNTESIILKNRYIMEQVVKELNLKGAFGKADPVKTVMSMVELKPIKGTEIIEISVKSQKAEVAAGMANAICKIIITGSVKEKFAFEKDMVAWLSEQAQNIKKDLDDSRARLLEFKKSFGAVDLKLEYKNANERLAKLQANTGLVKAERQDAESAYANMESLLKAGTKPDELPQVVSDNSYKEIKLTYEKNKMQMEELLKKYQPDHPSVAEITSGVSIAEKTLANRVSEIISNIQQRYKVAKAKDEELQETAKKQSDEVVNLEEQLNKYSSLSEDVKIKEALSDSFLKKTEEELIGGIKVQDVSLVEQAYFPSRKERKPMPFVLGVGLLFGFVATFIYKIYKERGKTKIVTKKVGIPQPKPKDKGMYIERVREDQ